MFKKDKADGVVLLGSKEVINCLKLLIKSKDYKFSMPAKDAVLTEPRTRPC